MMCRFLKSVFLCCLLVLSPGAARAAQTILPRPTPPEPPPIVPTLRVQGAERPVRLETLDVRIDIQGGVAEVALDMLFRNPNARVLEGELQFPLLPGQEISGLALDIQGAMRRGVPVPKARGQEIFDDVARRNVDPALLEATQGNAYRLRIYPIPANGTRRVAVRILQPLEEEKGMLAFRLPLAFAKHLDRFSVEAVVASDAEPEVESGSLGLVLGRAGLLFRGKAEKSDLSPEGLLAISIPAEASPEKSVSAVRWNDKVYFTATAFVDAATRKRELPRLVTLVWDASGSGGERDHAREYELLDSYFAALGDGRARLIVLRNAAEPARDFRIRDGDWSELKAVLHSLAYDGGTDLAAWKPADDCDEYLLFSDGLANFGKSLEGEALPSLRPGQRLYAVSSTVGADHALLRRAGGGRQVDLLRHDAAAAARLLLEDGVRVSVAPGALAGRGEALLSPVEARDSDRVQYRLAGWVKARSGTAAETVSLRVEHPDGRTESLSVPVPMDSSVPVHAEEDAPLTARLWGRCAIAELEANARLHKAAILRLGEEFGVVSRETSLLVLETAEDYARYDVAPPASLKAEVERLRARAATRRGGGTEYLPMDVLERRWKERVAWWERDFSKTGGKRQKTQAVSGTRSDAETGAERIFQELARRSAQANPSRGDFLMEEEIAPGAFGAMPNAMSMSAVAPRAANAPMAAPGQERESSTGRGSGGADRAIGIRLQAWRSDAPYIARMNRADKDEMYAIYLDERPGHSRSSAFYLDMADRFFAANMPELGLRVLSNLAEIDVENRQLLRMLAYRLSEAGEAGAALGIFEKVRELAPYEPQSLRDLATVHKALGNDGQAAELLYEVALRAWDDRFSDVNVIALTELNALVALKGDAVDASAFDSRLIRNLASDLRVTLSWDADNTDMDLWVTDPDGEKCFYDNRLTAQGGAMSRDCTGGYGPEEFMLRKARPGTYRVEVDYYGSSRQVLSGEVTLYVTLTTGFGTAGQKEQVVTMRLKDKKERVLVGEFSYDGAP